MATLTPVPKIQFFDANGNPLAGGKLYSYDAGTTTPRPTYTNYGGATPNANPVILDSRGEANVWLDNSLYKLKLTSATDVEIWTVDNVGGPDQATLAQLAASGGSALVGFIQAGAGAVTRTAQAKMRDTISAFDYMTTAEIAAVQSYAYAVDMTATLQNAINQAFALQADLFIPAGGYSVTGLYLPGRVSGGTDDRGKAFRLYGQGTGEPFVVSAPRGTVIKSVTNAPVLQDYLDTDPSSNGTVEIDHLRFDGTSSTPVVLLQSFYGTSSFYKNVIYQRGTGDGLKLGYSATVWVHECYALNKDFVTFTLGAARTGVGFNYVPSYDGGLVTISKCTSRGWLTAYRIGGGAGKAYNAAIRDSECSVVYNGIILDDTRKAIVSGCYMEGGDQGIGITDIGDWSTIRDTLIFPGFAKGIDSTSTSTKGTLIEGNLVATGAVVNAIGIDIASSAAFGGFNKNVIGNSIVYTLGTAGVNGIKISGTEPRLNVMGNMFDPRGAWTGAGSTKINDTSTSGITGLVTGQTGDFETAYLSNAAIAIRQGSSALTESNVTANNLTVPNSVSYFSCTATVATTVQRFTAGQTSGRLVTFRTTNGNMTFTDTAYNQLAGGVSFTGPGTITFLIDRIGADSYGWEVSRTVF